MLVGNREIADFLDARASWRRALFLRVETSELLRTGGSRSMTARQRQLLAEVRDQLRTDMRQRRRRPLRGKVSVEIEIFAGDVGWPPTAPKSVKRYLDALNGIAYLDDHQIYHLLVRRFARDHPYVRRTRPVVGDGAQGADRRPSAFMTIRPLRLCTADYDRAFRFEDEIRESADYEDAHAFWEDSWESADDLRMDELLDERIDDKRGEGIYGIGDPELAEWSRGFREQQIAKLRDKLLIDQGPGRGDRPGPRPMYLDPAFLAGYNLPKFDPLDRAALPGRFWLSLPPEAPGAPPWTESVRQEMAAHREQWRILPKSLDEPLALDVAISGVGGNDRDVDNIVHDVLVAFEEQFCDDQRGTVTAYRAYRCDRDHAGVCVQIVSEGRLRGLEDAIATARDIVISRGGRD